MMVGLTIFRVSQRRALRRQNGPGICYESNNIAVHTELPVLPPRKGENIQNVRLFNYIRHSRK